MGVLEDYSATKIYALIIHLRVHPNRPFSKVFSVFPPEFSKTLD